MDVDQLAQMVGLQTQLVNSQEDSDLSCGQSVALAPMSRREASL